MSNTFLDLIRLNKLGDDGLSFETVSKPRKMGNTADIAYGGCTIAVAINAAFQTLPTSDIPFAIYSCLGHYLGPAFVDRTTILRVTRIRDTRTFATRQVVAYQKQNDGSERACLSVICDFIASPPKRPSFLEYSLAPSEPTSAPSELPLYETSIAERVKAKDLHPQAAQVYLTVFGLANEVSLTKLPPEGPLAVNLWGVDKTRKTSQDDRKLADKRSIDWYKARNGLEDQSSPGKSLVTSKAAANAAFIAFTLDGALSFIPLSLSHSFITDVGACSSLDFALRFHKDEIDMENWHVREMATHAGGDQRTFSESRLWTEEKQLVATMSQQSVMRPKTAKL